MQSSSKEDHDFFLLVKARDKEAFAVIYKKYHGYLYALALRYLKDVELAEDVVQHVFVKLWETSKQIEIEINLKNYLYTMTKNHILNQIRNNKSHLSISYANAQQEIVDESDIFEAFEKLELTNLLHKKIEELPLQKRQVCELKLAGDLTNQQIADEMGITIHTVKSHYQESLKILRKYFNNIKMLFF